MGTAIELSPTAFSAHIEKEWTPAAYNFAKGLENFKVAIARSGQEIFSKSFELERFNTAGSTAWTKLSERRVKARGSAHPILTDTGALRSSISYRIEGRTNMPQYDEGYWLNGAERTFTTNRMLLKYNKGSLTQMRNRKVPLGKQRYKVTGERRYKVTSMKAASYSPIGKVVLFTNPAAFKQTASGICYAAIHNEGSEGGYRYGKFGGAAIKRQFMGHSTYMDFAIQDYSEVHVGFNLPGVL